MSLYRVSIREIEIYSMEVEAEDEQDAVDKAWELLDSEEAKAKYHNDSDGESSAFEI